MASGKKPKMSSGYAYELTGDRTGPGAWTHTDSERWETVVHTATGAESFRGVRVIDGGWVNVWRCEDGTFRAQTRIGA